MREFLVLLGEILFITSLQYIFEVFVDAKNHPYQSQMLTVTCFMGSLYLLLRFAANHLFEELRTVLQLPF